MLVHTAALEGGDAGAALFQDGVILKHPQEGVDLFGLAGQLKDHAVGGQVDDLGLVDVCDLLQFGPVGDVGRHLEQQQLPLQRVLVVQDKDLVGDLQPLGLQQQLVQLAAVAEDGDGDAADGGIVGGRDGQAVDVEAPAGEKAGDAGQNAGLVIHQQADHFALFRNTHADTLLIPS